MLWKSAGDEFENLLASAAIDPAWVEDGTPVEVSKVLHASSDGKFVIQAWQCEGPVSLRLKDYPCDEFITIAEGEVELTSPGGEVLRLAKGDSFMIRKGHSGPWRHVGRLRKFSVCYLG